MTKIQKLIQLSWREKSLLAQATLLLPLNAVGLRFVGLKSWQAVLSRLLRLTRAVTTPLSQEQIEATVRLVDWAARYAVVPANCLQRSLALRWLLRRQGIHCELRVGVRLIEGKCEAHAWLEYEGRVLNDSADVRLRFTPFAGTIFPQGANIQ